MAQQEIIVLIALVMVTYPVVLLSNFFFYQKCPRERWPMVLTATIAWWGPVTLLGWVWDTIPAWFVGAQLLCLTAAFLATMTLKLFQYRKAAFKAQGAQLVPWQKEMLADVDYSLDQQAKHIQLAIADRLELEKLLRRAEERQRALDEAIQQMQLYGKISQQTLDDFGDGLVRCYLARRQQVEEDALREEARE